MDHAEPAAQLDHERCRMLVEHAPDGIFLADAEGRFVEVNAAACEMLGYTRDELLRMSYLDVVPAEERADAANLFENIREGGHTRVERRLRRKDGSTVWVDIWSWVAPDRNRHAIVRDIAERVNTLEALRESQQRLQGVLASAPILVGALDKEGVVTLSEGRLLSVFGLRPGDTVGMSVWERYRDYPEIRDAARRALAGESSTVTSKIRDIEFEVHYAPVRDGDGNIAGAMAVGIDVTERKRMEEQFLQVQKMETVGRLAGGVAHDVNNLMTAIIFNTDLALRALGAQHAVAPDLRETHMIAERAANMAHQLLAFSRREVIEPRVLDLNDLIGSVERMLRRLIGEDIELVTLAAPDLGAVRVDPTQFEQVLINLAVNARDAMPRGGRLTIGTANVTVDAAAAVRVADISAGAYVRLTVSDTGEGISEEVRAHLFEPFYTTKATGEGTGLGLAACYGIVKQAGGSIAVGSEPGRGTTFSIYLPRVGEHAVPLAVAGGAMLAHLPRGTETILLVEDEDALRELALRILSGLGYAVIAAANGEEALRAAAAAGGIDLLLTDVVMPVMGGKALADRLSAERAALKVLFTSGYTDDAIVRHGVDERETPFLRKPFSPRTLARKVRELLDAPA